MKKTLAFAAILLVVISACFFGGCVKAVVYFNPDGGNIVVGDSTALYDGKIEVTAPDVSRDGYVFRGWNGEFGNPEEDITVNAVWDKLYTVTFDPIGGEETDTASAQTLTSSDTVVYPADPTLEGYVFDGWDKDVVNVSEDMVITGKWKKLYTVTFNLSGGTTTETELLSQIIIEGEAAKAPVAEKKYMKPVTWDKEFSNITADIEVVAQWERRELTSNEIAELVTPVTVEINTYRWNDTKWMTGSGFFIDGNGTIVTNCHVIKDAYRITAKLSDGTELAVNNIISFDENLDLAVIRVNKQDTPYLENATIMPEKGEVVYAIGSSLGLDGTFTSGLVSTVSREFDGQTYIQTSASISAGNSGGPLVNNKGFIIGINTFTIKDGQNLNFAIPVDRLKSLRNINISVAVWFSTYSNIKYWMFEKIINEDRETKYPGTTGEFHLQAITSGDTVKGSYSFNGDWDYYYISNVSRKIDSSGNKLIYDLYAYFYTENDLFLDDSIVSFVKTPTLTRTSGGYLLSILPVDYDEIKVIKYGKYYIYQIKLNNYTSGVGVIITSSKSNYGDYQLFMVSLLAGTDTSAIDSAILGTDKTSIRKSGIKFVSISTVY